MDPVTVDHRKQELRRLLDLVASKPSHDLDRERERITVLQAMIAGAGRKPQAV